MGENHLKKILCTYRGSQGYEYPSPAASVLTGVILKWEIPLNHNRALK